MKRIFALLSLAALFLCTSYNAKAGDTISVSGSSLKISGAVNPTYIPAVGISSISYTAPNIVLKGSFGTLNVSYSRISQPSHTSARNLLLKIDSMANLAKGNAASINAVGWSAVNKSAHDSTQIKSGAGVLHSIVINTKGASSNQIKIWDGTTLIATIDGTASERTILYDIAFTVGLRIKSVTGTAANYTITYR